MTAQERYLILVVDDDTDLLDAIRECLEFEGYAVETALNGEEGLDKLASISPHLIILDMNMPGMGGFPFLRALEASEQLSKIPVFVFTARANLEEFFEGVDVAGFMAKPCEPDDLLREVKRVLTARYGSGPGRQGAAAGGRKRMLYAEQDGGRRALLCMSFERAGYDVTVVSTGNEVLEKVAALKPDVIVMRLILEGMNGDSVALALDAMPGVAKTPVVLYEDSGAVPRDRQTVEKAEGRRKFIKSSRPEDLVASVRLILEMQEQE